MDQIERPVPSPDPGGHRVTAIHAYEHAADAQRLHPHQLNVVDVPEQAVHGVITGRMAPIQLEGAKAETLSHAFKSPTETAFKLGFGFTAGAWSFRTLVTLGVGTLLLLGIVRLLLVFPG
jgi:hypothetical protein